MALVFAAAVAAVVAAEVAAGVLDAAGALLPQATVSTAVAMPARISVGFNMRRIHSCRVGAV
jgi:hypothetical protein